VRDVAYSQIPRADRARRHRAAAAWIEHKGGERVEDLADVLAYHYLQALELAEASGDMEQAGDMRGPARRFLALAGERALGLDTAQAEARLAHALKLTPPDDPQRPDLLVRWAEAAFQAGKLRDSADALEEALPALRARGDQEAAARALQLRSRIALRLGEDQMVELALQAIELLEQQPANEALVAAYGQLANAQAIAGGLEEAIAAADRAGALAESLGLPEPARAFGYRGFARALLGDEDGLAEMERALAALIAQGAGRDAAVMQNNLGVLRYPLQGPKRSLATFDEAVAFGEQRGLGEAALICAANCPGLLVELGRPREALVRAAKLIPAAEASGDTHSLSEVRAVELATRIACGETGLAAEAKWLVEGASDSGAFDIIVVTLASAAAGLLAESPDEACAALDEVKRRTSPRETTYFSKHLAGMVRVALAADQRDLGEQLTAEMAPRYPLEEHALRAARAQLAEDAGDYGEAANLYAEAAAGWHDFGNVPEEAHALLGQGRCLHALGDSHTEEPLSRAHALFASMGYKPALAETAALLEHHAPAPTS
jgi:tetratricopeptide (TPR) repeat protein